jgi:hypothetical protein
MRLSEGIYLAQVWPGSQYRDEDRCTLVFWRWCNQPGAFHEAANLAALWKLPVVLSARTTCLAWETHVGRATVVKELTIEPRI